MHRLFARAAFRAQWRALMALALLVAAAVAALFVRPGGTELYPNYNFVARAPIRDGAEVNVPVVVSGRLPAPERVREVAISERLASDLGVGVGDDLPLESMTDAWVETAYTGGNAGPPDGPRVRVRVVGIVRSPADFGRVFGVLHLTPAFLARSGDVVSTYLRVEVVADPSAFGALRSAFSDSGEFSVFADEGSTDDGLNTIATALRFVAVVAAIAGAATVGFAIARSTRAAVRDRQALVALGATRAQLVGAALVVVVPATAVGALVGGLLGAVATPDVMVGLAARIEPSATRAAVDWPVVIGAMGGAIVLAMACVAVVAGRGARTGAPRARPPVAIVPLDRPLPVVLGLRHAVAGESERGGADEPGRDRGRGPGPRRSRRGARREQLDPAAPLRPVAVRQRRHEPIRRQRRVGRGVRRVDAAARVRPAGEVAQRAAHQLRGARRGARRHLACSRPPTRTTRRLDRWWPFASGASGGRLRTRHAGATRQGRWGTGADEGTRGGGERPHRRLDPVPRRRLHLRRGRCDDRGGRRAHHRRRPRHRADPFRPLRLAGWGRRSSRSSRWSPSPTPWS